MIDNTELVDFETYRFPNLKFKLTKEDLKEYRRMEKGVMEEERKLLNFLKNRG